MKRLYWRPQKCSQTALLMIAALAVVGMAMVEFFPVRDNTPLAAAKLAAARRAAECFDAIRSERLARGYPLDAEIDPTGSGVLGLTASPVTSITGHLASKQASLNPNFAAAIVQMLHEAGVQPGDLIAQLLFDGVLLFDDRTEAGLQIFDCSLAVHQALR